MEGVMTEEIEELPASYFYKVEDIAVPEEDPWKNDLLGRKEGAGLKTAEDYYAN